MTTTFANKFNFKKIPVSLFAGLFSEYAQPSESKEVFYTRVANEFEVLDAKAVINTTEGSVVHADTGEPWNKDDKILKRKSIEMELTEPAMLEVIRSADIPQSEKDLTIDLVQKLVAEYVKLSFVDSFLPVGDYDLQSIIAFRAATGGRGAAIDSELLQAAVKSFTDFMVAALQSPEAGEMLGKIASARFTSSAVNRSGLAVTEETARKLQARVDQWGAHLNENNPDAADEFVPVYGLWTKALEKLQNSKPVDLANFL